MKLYELTVIFNPTLDDNSVQQEIDKIEKQITGSGGAIEKIDRWGMRRFTYRIGGHNQGNYIFFLFKSNPGVTSDIERSLRLNENVLRYLTILSPGLTPAAAKPIKPIEEEEGQFEDFTTQQD
jgi:small subunit ribosomal protein S6